MGNLSTAIDKLKDTTLSNFNEKFENYIICIDKYFDRDEQKAFMLGYLFSNHNFKTNISKDAEDAILYVIKNENLEDYFRHDVKPEFKDIKPLGLICLIIGFISLVAGVIQLLNGNIRIGIVSTSMTPVMHEGGTIVIFGLMLFIGGVIRYKFEQQKQAFIKNIQNININMF